MPELEDFITLSEAAAIVPGSPSHVTIWRWVRRGVKARNGQRIRLRHGRMGGRILTTAAWLRDFGEEVALHDDDAFPDPADDDTTSPAPGRRTTTNKRRKSRKTQRSKTKVEAERTLDRVGITA